jgi:hypothetical protein
MEAPGDTVARAGVLPPLEKGEGWDGGDALEQELALVTRENIELKTRHAQLESALRLTLAIERGNAID